MDGIYALANPEEGAVPKVTFSMNAEYNLYAKCTHLCGTETCTFPDIEDEPQQVEIKEEKTSWWAVAGFIAGTIVLGAIAVACAPVSAAVVIGCMGAFAVTAAGINLGMQVFSNGWDSVDWGSVVISGCCGAMSAAFALISWPASSEVIGSVLGAETVAFNWLTQGAFNGGLAAVQTAVTGGDFWSVGDSFVFGFAAGALGGSGYSYVPGLHFWYGKVIKDMIVGGLAKGFVFGNVAPFAQKAAETYDGQDKPFTKRSYEQIEGLFEEDSVFSD